MVCFELRNDILFWFFICFGISFYGIVIHLSPPILLSDIENLFGTLPLFLLFFCFACLGLLFEQEGVNRLRELDT